MRRLVSGVVFTAALVAGVPMAKAQTPYLAQIQNFAFTFCPQGWVPTSGQLMLISQNTALFSLLGTNYGGNGTTTFGLPYLRPTLAGNRFPLTSCIAVAGIFPSPN